MPWERTTREYQTIATYYGDRKADRSQVLLMEHIDGGLFILRKLVATDLTLRAWCLHPIVQSGSKVMWSPAYDLALEYRIKANAYLCTPENDFIQTTDDVAGLVGTMSQACAQMLMADKLQNKMGFIQYHLNKHERSDQLTQYFDLWLEFLRSGRWENLNG